MTQDLFDFPAPYAARAKKNNVPLTLVKEGTYKAWLKKQAAGIKALAEQCDFNPQGANILIQRNAKGDIKQVFGGVKDDICRYDVAAIAAAVQKELSAKALSSTTFALENSDLEAKELHTVLLGWGLAGYKFDLYKSEVENKKPAPVMVWPKGADKDGVTGALSAISLTRNLINTPPNDMGPDELEDAARILAKTFKAKIKVIHDQKLLAEDFPLIYAVGQGSERRPRLIEINWGKKSEPLITLVGKGVCFDTGGLNLKPEKPMSLMKKDMGGAAHVLGLGWMIMASQMPVRLRILVPAVENSVSGAAYRPSDVLPSRKGLFVENTNTDAEGRLILADSLTYASEDENDKPEIIIDYATLTGSARAGLGLDIPGTFATNKDTGARLQDISFGINDPVWIMPLYQPYKKHIKSATGDLVNSASVPGDLIYSALFLHSFLEGTQNWVHLDCFAWESSGKPGRPKGGADTGLLSVFELLKEKFAI